LDNLIRWLSDVHVRPFNGAVQATCLDRYLLLRFIDSQSHISTYVWCSSESSRTTRTPYTRPYRRHTYIHPGTVTRTHTYAYCIRRRLRPLLLLRTAPLTAANSTLRSPPCLRASALLALKKAQHSTAHTTLQQIRRSGLQEQETRQGERRKAPKHHVSCGRWFVVLGMWCSAEL